MAAHKDFRLKESSWKHLDMRAAAAADIAAFLGNWKSCSSGKEFVEVVAV